MSTPDDDAVAAGHSVDLAGWREMFDELMWLVAGRFGRVEPRRTARQFVAGLLSPVERKNCWWLAELQTTNAEAVPPQTDSGRVLRDDPAPGPIPPGVAMVELRSLVGTQ